MHLLANMQAAGQKRQVLRSGNQQTKQTILCRGEINVLFAPPPFVIDMIRRIQLHYYIYFISSPQRALTVSPEDVLLIWMCLRRTFITCAGDTLTDGYD